jgi:hypothetical protein
LIWCLMTIIVDKCGCVCAPIPKTISSCTYVLEVSSLHWCLRFYNYICNCTFKQVNVLKLKCTLCKQTLKYISYFNKDNIRICLRDLKWMFWTRNSKTEKGSLLNRIFNDEMNDFWSAKCSSLSWLLFP